MHSMVVIIVLLLFFCDFGCFQETAKDDPSHNWDYQSHGPDVWAHDFKTCSGLRQSPINIDPKNVEYNKMLKPFNFINYNRLFRWNVSHNGHTVVVSKINGDNIFINGSDFTQPFKLLQFHFHWGYNDYQGSEHFMAGEKYPLEIHLVHQSKTGHLAVLAVLFQLSEFDNPKLNSLLKAISHTNDIRNWEEVNLSLETIFPSASLLENYYRYNGSLTTPPCTEGVIWSVFKSNVNISPHQLLSFRTNIVRSNYREPQRIYKRKVFSSYLNRPSGKESHEQSAKNDSITLFISWKYLVIKIFTAFMIFILS